jgi:two-component sensor histidine kinase
LGVEPNVLRIVMQWTFRQKGWRALFIKTALMAVLWLVVAFVFATEFYLSARGGPIKISWTAAAASALHDWFPWVLLSPVAVILGERFRFDRNTWRHSLMAHITACLFFIIAYEGLLLLVYPTAFTFSARGVDGGIGIFQAVGSSSFPLPASSNAAVFESGKLQFGMGPMSLSANSNVLTVVGVGNDSSFTPSAGHVGFGSSFLPVSRWTQFLRLAMMRTQFTIPIYWCIVCVCWVVHHFQETSERERRTLELETRLTGANLQALKMQLQPHFLFNTLNSISSLIYENPKAADDMVASLSQFLRTTLDVSETNEVPLRKELDFTDRYLEIQQTRFGDRLRIRREIGSAVMEAQVPPLILQPLVENAVRHGIETRETGGTVTIRALRKGDVLHLEVSDDGEGFRNGQLLGAGNGVGLSNTKARLQGLYGNKHQFKLTVNEPSGACVRIDIPFRLSQSGAREI